MWQCRPPVGSQILSRSPGGAARGGDDRVAGLRLPVEHADQLALAHRLAVVMR